MTLIKRYKKLSSFLYTISIFLIVVTSHFRLQANIIHSSEFNKNIQSISGDSKSLKELMTSLKSIYIEGYFSEAQFNLDKIDSNNSNILTNPLLSNQFRPKKRYLLIENGLIQKISNRPFKVSEQTFKILEKETGPLLLSAGFIDLHGHQKYHIIPLWSEAQGQFSNRFEWRNLSSYKNAVTKPLNLPTIGVNTDLNSHLCKTYHYAEIKSLLGGTTTVQGVGADQSCTTNLYARNAEIESDFSTETDVRVNMEPLNPNNAIKIYNDIILEESLKTNLPLEQIMQNKFQESQSLETSQTSTQKMFFEMQQSIMQYLNRIFPLGNIRTFIVHLSEGHPQDMYNQLEFQIFKSLNYNKEGLTIIHGTGMSRDDLKEASLNKINLVWSPVSNLLLYGATLDIQSALEFNVNTSLGADWSPSGSKNLLDEARVAREYLLLHRIAPPHLVDLTIYKMMTLNPAKALKLDHLLGQIKVGYYADLVAFKLKSKNINTLTQIIDAKPQDLVFTMINGQFKILKTNTAPFHSLSSYDESIKLSASLQNTIDSKSKDSNLNSCQFLNQLVVVPETEKFLTIYNDLKNYYPLIDSLTDCNDEFYKKTLSELVKKGISQGQTSIVKPELLKLKSNLEILNQKNERH